MVRLQLLDPDDLSFCASPHPSQKAVNKGVVDGRDAESYQIMPAEAHGDEHDVVHVLLVPLWGSKRREQDKSNLPEPGSLQDKESGSEKLQHNVIAEDDLQRDTDGR